MESSEWRDAESDSTQERGVSMQGGGVGGECEERNRTVIDLTVDYRLSERKAAPFAGGNRTIDSRTVIESSIIG